jgi:hypothetical protein
VFSFSATIVALLLVPTFLCILIFHLAFQRNTLKLSEAQLFPVGLAFTLLFNMNRIPRFFELVDPPSSFEDASARRVFLENVIFRAHEIRAIYAQFCFVPVVAFAFLVFLLWACHRRWIVNPQCWWPCGPIGRFVDANFVNCRISAICARRFPGLVPPVRD